MARSARSRRCSRRQRKAGPGPLLRTRFSRFLGLGPWYVGENWPRERGACALDDELGEAGAA
jgi:hypothetical protein